MVPVAARAQQGPAVPERPMGEILYATDDNSGLWTFTVELLGPIS